MIPAHIANANVQLAKGQEEYTTLPAVFCKVKGRPMFITAWEPTPEELEKLNKGGKVLLFVSGDQHPPVKLGVGEPPDEN
jgi:hypothetical protein